MSRLTIAATSLLAACLAAGVSHADALSTPAMGATLAANPNPFSDVAGTNVVNLKIGGRVTWHDDQSFYFGWGRALTDARWYKDIIRFEYRMSF